MVAVNADEEAFPSDVCPVTFNVEEIAADVPVIAPREATVE